MPLFEGVNSRSNQHTKIAVFVSQMSVCMTRPRDGLNNMGQSRYKTEEKADVKAGNRTTNIVPILGCALFSSRNELTRDLFLPQGIIDQRNEINHCPAWGPSFGILIEGKRGVKTLKRRAKKSE